MRDIFDLSDLTIKVTKTTKIYQEIQKKIIILRKILINKSIDRDPQVN